MREPALKKFFIALGREDLDILGKRRSQLVKLSKCHVLFGPRKSRVQRKSFDIAGERDRIQFSVFFKSAEEVIEVIIPIDARIRIKKRIKINKHVLVIELRYGGITDQDIRAVTGEHVHREFIHALPQALFIGFETSRHVRVCHVVIDLDPCLIIGIEVIV